MNGTAVLGVQPINGSQGGNWTLAASGDYSGDGWCDLLWRDPNTGENLLWKLDGTSVIGTQYIDSKGGANWRVVGPR